MIHEAFGLDDVQRRHADRLAGFGYLTLAADLFSGGGAVRCLVSTMRAFGRGQGAAFADIRAARSRLVDSTDCTGRIGVIGFCMGGSFALLTASEYDVAAVNGPQVLRPLMRVAGIGPESLAAADAWARIETFFAAHLR